MDVLVNDLKDMINKIEPLLYFLNPSFLSNDFNVEEISVETYNSICNLNYVRFGENIMEENLKIINFFEDLLRKYRNEESEIIIEKISRIRYNNRYYYDSFVLMVDIFNIIKKYRHPIYGVMLMVSYCNFEDRKMIFLRNIVMILLKMVDLENKRRKVMRCYNRYGVNCILNRLH